MNLATLRRERGCAGPCPTSAGVLRFPLGGGLTSSSASGWPDCPGACPLRGFAISPCSLRQWRPRSRGAATAARRACELAETVLPRVSIAGSTTDKATAIGPAALGTICMFSKTSLFRCESHPVDKPSAKTVPRVAKSKRMFPAWRRISRIREEIRLRQRTGCCTAGCFADPVTPASRQRLETTATT